MPKNSDFGDPAPLAPITIMSNLSDFAKFAIAFTVSFDVTIFSSKSIPCLAAGWFLHCS